MNSDESQAIKAKVAGAFRKAPASISAADLQNAEFKPIGWVVPDICPDGLTLLGGKPKRGKSWLALDMCNTVARGGYTLGDRKCIEGDVLYAALEDNQRRLKGRMKKVCPTGAWSPRLTFWTEMPRIEDGGIDDLRAWIASQPRPRLIVIDTLVKVRAAKDKGENVYDADYRTTAPLKQLADETGVAVLLIHHLRKQGAEEDPFDAISGSTGLTGVVDTILVLNRSGNGETLYGRGRDIPEIELAVQFDKESCRWSVLGDADEVHRSKERTVILDALKLAPDPMTPRDVTDVTGSSYASVRRLLAAMFAAGQIKRPERGKYAAF